MAVYIITHKKYEKKFHNEGYKDLLVGAYKGHVFGDYYDDYGENISEKNANYCELTGLYWLWKHCKDDYIGVVHYRRFFSHSFFANSILTEKEIQQLLKKYDIIMPFHAKYDKTIREDYSEISGFDSDLIKIRQILEKKYPDYLNVYDRYLNGNTGHLYNMMITSKQNFDAYCEWLFSILFELEETTDLSLYNDYQKRIYGFLAERLLNVWVFQNHLRVCEVGIILPEEKRTIGKKILTGLKRSILFRAL